MLLYRVLLMLFMLGNASCATKEDKATIERRRAVLASAQELTERAYDLKRTGHNGPAQKIFKQVYEHLLPAVGPKSEPVASNLDDQASVFMRTGDYDNARRFYTKALDILDDIDAPLDPYLADSIRRRIKTLDALERQNITCAELLLPPPSTVTADAGPTADYLPYFPNIDDVYAVFAKMNARLTSCLQRPKQPFTVWIVLSSTGRIIRAETRNMLAGTPEARCVEERIMAINPEFKSQFPRFRACFKNFNYPFLLGN